MSIDTEGYVCWVNEEERVLSFHQEPGYEKKEFRDKEDFQSFYMILTSSSYKVMWGIIMGFWIFMMAMDLLFPVIMIVMGRYFMKTSPKEINYIF